MNNTNKSDKKTQQLLSVLQRFPPKDVMSGPLCSIFSTPVVIQLPQTGPVLQIGYTGVTGGKKVHLLKFKYN